MAVLMMLLVGPVFGSTHESGVRLHMGSDFQSFSDGTTEQPIVLSRSGCTLSAATLAGPLVTLSSVGGKVGLFDRSIGVKAGGSNGTPCSLVDSSEELVIESAPGRPEWTSLRMDLELKGNAWVVVELLDGNDLVGTFTLLTGSSIDDYNTDTGSSESPEPGFPYTALSTGGDRVAACASPSDSGPDSGPSDNCLWTIQPGADFDRVVMTTLVGTASLEGSGDFGDVPDHDTMFFYNQVCGGETVGDVDGSVSGSFTLIALPNVCKPYGLNAHESGVDFDLNEGVDVPFRGFLQFGGQAAPGGVNGQALQYDPDGAGPAGYRVVELCVGPTFDGDGNVLADSSILPPGETWCLASMISTADGDGLFVNVYQVYGEGDPGFRVS
jgi:hypothetical protein